MAAQPDGMAAGPEPCRPRRPCFPTLIVAAAVLAAALLIQTSTPAQAALELHRQRIAAGQWWRLWTGSFVHFSWLHLVADAAAFALLCGVAAGRRLPTAPMVVASAAVVGLAVWCGGGVVSYRGLSGVNCALLGLVLVAMARRDPPALAAAWLTGLTLMFARSLFETGTGRTLLPTSLPEGVEVAGAAHLAGLAMGTLWGALAGRGRARRGSGLPTKRPWRAAKGCVIRKAL